MRTLTFTILFLLSANLVSAQISTGQKRNNLIERQPDRVIPQTTEIQKVFQRIESGLSGGVPESFQGLLLNQLSVNLGGNERGLYSNNQAISLLTTFFSSRKPLSFSFTRFNDRGPNPYGTGRLVYLHKGRRETAQVYVSLVERDSVWYVNQFNIY